MSPFDWCARITAVEPFAEAVSDELRAVGGAEPELAAADAGVARGLRTCVRPGGEKGDAHEEQ